MTAATKDVKTDSYGGESSPIPTLYAFPLAAGALIYAGTFVATDASGNAIKGSANNALKLWGRAESQVDNTAGSAGDKYVNVKPGVFFFNNGAGADAVANSNRGQYVFVLDDNTVSVGDAGGVRPLAGYVIDVPASGAPEFGKVAVAVGMARPDALDPELASSSATAFKARVVATSINAYTAAAGVVSVTATGAVGTQDGATLAVADLLLIPEGLTNITAADAGPYTVTTLGNTAAGPTFTRPDWWPHGGTITQGAVIQVGGDGSLYKGSAWKAFVAKAKLIGTDAPALYPDFVCQAATLVGGSATITNVPILSATKTYFGVNRVTSAGQTGATVQFNPSSATAGILGTATATLQAQAATGGIVASDTSAVNIAVHNW